MMRKILFTLAFLLVAACSLCSCAKGDVIDAEVELVIPQNQDPFQSLDKIVFTLVNADDAEDTVVFNYPAVNGFSDISVNKGGLRVRSRYYLKAEGVNAVGEVLAFGKTAIYDARAFEGETIALYFAKANSLSMPSVSASFAQKRDGGAFAAPSAFDVLFIGGQSREGDETYGETVRAIEQFNAYTYRLQTLTIDSDAAFALTQGLIGHTATKLDLVSAVVVGGASVDGVLDDPKRHVTLVTSQEGGLYETIEPPSSFTARMHHAACYLPAKDAVLISGGEAGEARFDGLFRIEANGYAMRKIGALKEGRAHHSATYIFGENLDDMTGVLFFGGGEQFIAEWLAEGESQTEAIPFDFNEGDFTGHSVIAIGGNRALIMGGQKDGAPSADAILFSADCVGNNGCEPLISIQDVFQTPRSNFTLTRFSETLAIACGGQDENGQAIGDCEIIDFQNPQEPQSTATLPMGQARFNHSAILLPDDAVLISGGFHHEQGSISQTEIFRPVID